MSLFTALAELMIGTMMVGPLAWELLSKERRAERAKAPCASVKAEANA